MSRLLIIRNSLFIISTIFILLNTPLHADFVALYGWESFEDSLKYPGWGRAPMYRIRDMNASEIESKNGVIFSGEGESTVRIHQKDDFNGGFTGKSSADRCIEHVPSGVSSAGEGIVIRFKYPVSKFAVGLGRASVFDQYFDDFETASLHAYTDNGQFIGTTKMKATSPNLVFGFETTSGSGVSFVVMDYGEAEAPEKIDTIYYKYKTTHPFKVILPQIAHGTVSGASIESDLILFWDDSATVSVISPLGVPLVSQILDEGNEFNLASEPRTSRQEYFKSSTIPGLDDLTVGYVVAESDYPIDGQVVYRTTDAEGKVYEADIRGCVPETYLQIPFELNQAENLNAALAIVNPSDTVAEIEIHVNDAEGSYTEFWDPPIFTLQPGEQRALFMHELWDEMPSENGNYILQLRSAVPFAAAAFYTRNRTVVGNLPVWSYKEGQAR